MCRCCRILLMMVMLCECDDNDLFAECGSGAAQQRTRGSSDAGEYEVQETAQQPRRPARFHSLHFLYCTHLLMFYIGSSV